MDAIRGSRVCARPSSTRALVRPRSPISNGRVSGTTVGVSGRGLSARRRAANTERAAEQNEVLDQILKTIRSARAANTNPDYFELLGVEVGDDLKKIKKSYRARARVCHPDVAGEDGHEACIVLNEAYATLMDEDLREAYEFEQEEFDYYDDGNVFAKAMKETPYTGEPLSKQVPLDHFANRIEKDDLLRQGEQLAKAVFVDEISCIGCQYCVTCAAATFRNDEDTGRARVFGQWLSTEDEIQEAIDMCPVDCIHWVPKEQLAPLEYVMQHVLTERVGVSMMMSGQGAHRMEDGFQKTREFLKFLSQREEKRDAVLKERKRKAEMKRAREEMMRQQQEQWDQRKKDAWKRANGTGS